MINSLHICWYDISQKIEDRTGLAQITSKSLESSRYSEGDYLPILSTLKGSKTKYDEYGAKPKRRAATKSKVYMTLLKLVGDQQRS